MFFPHHILLPFISFCFPPCVKNCCLHHCLASFPNIIFPLKMLSYKDSMMEQIFHPHRQDQMLMNQYDRSNQMTANEVIVRLKDIMSRTSTSLHKSFLKYDKQNKGQISKKQFREVSVRVFLFKFVRSYFKRVKSFVFIICMHFKINC